MMSTTTAGSIARAPRPSSLADVLDLILDKGLVIDAYIRVSAVGIEVLTIDARIVIASVDTYLHYAEAVNRLDLTQTETKGITGLFGDDASSDGSASNGSTAGANGRSGVSAPSGGSGRSSARPGSGGDRASNGRALGRGDESSRTSGRSRQNGDSDEGEGKGRALARRLSEKGKWSS